MHKSHAGRYLIVAALVATFTFLVYLPTLQNDFVNYDDDYYIYDNLHIRSIDITFFKWALGGIYAKNWHPLTWLSHALDYSLWGPNPLGHHLTSIVIHAFNSLLVLLLAIQLLAVVKSRERTGGQGTTGLSDATILTTGVVAGLLFGLHPIHVESVAWASERKDLLCTFFFLLSLLAYIRYARFTADEKNTGKPISWLSDKNYLLSLGFFILALLSKSMAVTLPVVLLIVDWYPMRRVHKDTLKRIVTEKVIFFVFAVNAGIITILAQGSQYAIRSSVAYPLTTRLLVGFNSIIAYMGKMIWPADLSPFYPYPAHVSLWSFDYMVPLLLVIIITIACTTILKRQRVWLAAWMYFLVTLSPVLGIIQVGDQAMADRYAYLPSISLFLLAALGVAVSIEKISTYFSLKPRVVKIGSIVILSIPFVCISYLTVKQIHVWQNSFSFWNKVVHFISLKDDAYYKNSFIGYFGRGAIYAEQNRLEEAVNDNQKALKMKPNFVLARCNLAMIYERQNKLDEAIGEYKAALKILPILIPAHYNLAMIYTKKNNTKDAIDEFETILRINPNFALAHQGLGTIYEKQNKVDEAINEYRLALKINPGLSESQNNLVRLDRARRLK
ncbi:MAG: tetratricopeptide repeat protein [Dissulfurispiraceae bacterium]